MIIDMINNHNICMFVNAVEGRLTTRVSAQIFSTKREYVYVAKTVKKLAAELEQQYEAGLLKRILKSHGTSSETQNSSTLI